MSKRISALPGVANDAGGVIKFIPLSEEELGKANYKELEKHDTAFVTSLINQLSWKELKMQLSWHSILHLLAIGRGGKHIL